nr:hypothetical protein [uncultured Enterobacter sp.]
MPINWQTVEGVFNDELYTFIGAIEAPVAENRLALHEVNGNPTIGIGFDLKVG